MTEDISDFIGNIEAMTREKVKANVQPDVAHHIQYGLVPKKAVLPAIP